MSYAWLAESRPESGLFRDPAKRTKVLQLPEEADGQPIFSKPSESVAVQQRVEQRPVVCGRRRVPVVVCHHRGPTATVQHDQLGFAAGFYFSSIHAGLPQQAARIHSPVGHTDEKQKQILSNSVINVFFKIRYVD